VSTPDQDDRARDGGGQFIQTQDGAERDAKAARMRAQGWSLQRISDELGYGGKQNVSRALEKLRERTVLPAAQELVAHELSILDHLIDKTMEVLGQDHLVVQHGRIVLQGEKPAEGEQDERKPLVDHDLTMKAVATLQRLTESRRKLLGLDAAVKVDLTQTTVDEQDLAIRDMISAARARNALAAQQIAGGE
jgi:hypothetical protein